MATPQTGKTFTDEALSAETSATRAVRENAVTQAGRASTGADRLEASEDAARLHAQSVGPFTDPVTGDPFPNGARGLAEQAARDLRDARALYDGSVPHSTLGEIPYGGMLGMYLALIDHAPTEYAGFPGFNDNPF